MTQRVFIGAEHNTTVYFLGGIKDKHYDVAITTEQYEQWKATQELFWAMQDELEDIVRAGDA